MTEAQRILLGALPGGNPAGAGLSLGAVVQNAIPSSSADSGVSATTFTSQLNLLGSAIQEQVAALTTNTQALTSSGTSPGGGAASTAVNIAKSAANSLAGGLSLVPLVSAVVGLFRSEKPEPPPLATYTLPQAIRFEGAAQRSLHEPVLAVDYGQDGMPRTIPAGAQYSGPPVTIQVQAIDSRSFLDHSSEIAGAVREAILNAHVLSDIVSEL